jgi:hypothetical protein
VPSRISVDELAVRLQKVLDTENERKKNGTPRTRLLPPAPPKRKAPLPKAPTTAAAARHTDVKLDWRQAFVSGHVKLVWGPDVDPGRPLRPTPAGARLTWGVQEP